MDQLGECSLFVGFLCVFPRRRSMRENELRPDSDQAVTAAIHLDVVSILAVLMRRLRQSETLAGLFTQQMQMKSCNTNTNE